jgi:selenocysteine lyase/cysteine desulfurase
VGSRKEDVRKQVAAHVGCAPDEIALTRNTTDGVTTVISGLPLKAGDEILATNQEHLPYVGMLHQRAARDGVEIRLLDLPSPAQSPVRLAEAFEKAITPKTRLVLVCHVYLSGQTPPVRQICDYAHARGVQVLVDGALAFGHVVANVKELDCDYYAGSFHKWGCGPSGTGFFYAKPEHVAALVPLYGYFDHQNMRPANDSASMRKFESFGTHPAALTYSIGQFFGFREAIGQQRIQARLHYLKRRWAEQVAKEPRIRFFASLEPELSCSLLTFQVDGMEYRDITAPLREKHNVYMGGAYIGGELGKRDTWKEVVFVNTAVFHTPADMDRAAAALLDTVRKS